MTSEAKNVDNAEAVLYSLRSPGLVAVSGEFGSSASFSAVGRLSVTIIWCSSINRVDRRKGEDEEGWERAKGAAETGEKDTGRLEEVDGI